MSSRAVCRGKFRCSHITLLQRDGRATLSYAGEHDEVFLPGAYIEADSVDGPTISIHMKNGLHFWRLTPATVDTMFIESIIETYKRYDCEVTVNRLRRLYDRLIQDITRLTRRRENGKLLTSEIQDLMEAVDKRRCDIVPCLLGAPGIGKTEGIETFAREHGRNVVHIITSQILPTEVSGMTMPNQETHSMDVFDHTRLSHMKDGDILFLDELLKGQQQVLSACLTLVQERRLMSGTMLPDVIIVAAANPLASPKMMPEEIRQRFLFLDVRFDEDSWQEYMVERGVPLPEHLLPHLVKDGGDGSTWNTLTPRTMTKLALWYKDAIGDACSMRMVERVVLQEFGNDVMDSIKKSLGEKVSEHSDDPMDQVRDFICRTVKQMPPVTNEREEDERTEVIKMLDEDEIDIPGLMSRIQNMSGGSEIMEALRNETMSLGDLGIGER